jgi:outer membrane protein assembly factor BamB
VLGTPIVHQGRAYAVIGQDPEHGEGIGNLVCIDAQGKQVWAYGKINRSMTTMAVVGDLLFAADYSGYLYCLDKDTGAEHWKYDTSAHIWGSVLVADGRVYVLGQRTCDQGVRCQERQGNRLRHPDLLVADRRQWRALHRDPHAPVRDREDG